MTKPTDQREPQGPGCERVNRSGEWASCHDGKGGAWRHTDAEECPACRPIPPGPETKTSNGYWSTSMRQKHEMQMAAHVQSYGAPLGHLREEPSQKVLDLALEDFKADKYGGGKQKPKRARSSG